MRLQNLVLLAAVGFYLSLVAANQHEKSSSDSIPELAQLSDLTGGTRNIAIFTTAGIPWMTGTAVNPILRAAHLARTKERHCVTLCVPWVPIEDQPTIFGNPKDRFNEPSEQERCMRRWARDNLGFWPKISIRFYDARYWASIGSIIASGDLTKLVPEEDRDVAILEEPEHLTWFHTGGDWTKKFKYVVGIVHTDYLTYRRNDPQIWSILRGSWAYGWRLLNKLVTRAYCHHVIKLSDAVQDFPKSVTCNTHGVRAKFLEVGRSKANAVVPRFQKGAYYIGKALWTKGYRQLVDNLKEHRRLTGQTVPLDVYGTGPDLEAIKEEVEREQLGWNFMGAIDHADPSLWEYKVLVNPSLSDVVCTTSAEALGMGKFVVCARHPSNVFFERFSQCFTYNSPSEFSLSLQHALAAEPAPMTGEMIRELSWETATERLFESAKVETDTSSKVDKILGRVHRSLCGVRTYMWGTPKATKQSPLIEAPPGNDDDEEPGPLQKDVEEARRNSGWMFGVWGVGNTEKAADEAKEHQEEDAELEKEQPVSMVESAAEEGDRVGKEMALQGAKKMDGTPQLGGRRLLVGASLSLLGMAAAALSGDMSQSKPLEEELSFSRVMELKEPVKLPTRRIAPVATQVPLRMDVEAEKVEALKQRQRDGQPAVNIFSGLSWLSK